MHKQLEQQERDHLSTIKHRDNLEDALEKVLGFFGWDDEWSSWYGIPQALCWANTRAYELLQGKE